MRQTKWLAAIILPLFLASFLQSQSLADLAKKEKERRAALKGKTATVITTADIAKVKKRPAVETAGQEQAAAIGTEAAQAGGQAQEGVIPPAGAGQAQAAAAEAGAVKPAEQPPATEAPPAQPPALSEKDYKAKQAELTKAAQDKQDLVDLLTLKMNSLYQEFYSLDNLKSRELVQAQISDTYDKLLKAQLDAQQATRDLETFLTTTKKEETPAIWIK